MTVGSALPRRAFAVWWKDLERWVIPTNLLLQQTLPPGWKHVRLRDLLRLTDTRVKVEPEREYKMAGVRWYGEGVFHRETVRGNGMSANYVTPLVPGALIYNRLFAWKASFAIVPTELSDCFVSNEFPQFIPDSNQVLPDYLYLFCTSDAAVRAVNAASTGSAAVSRNRFKEEKFLSFEIPLPPLPVQAAIIARWFQAKSQIGTANTRIDIRQAEVNARFLTDLGLNVPPQTIAPKCFAVWWKNIDRWGIQQIVQANLRRRMPAKYKEAALSEICRIGSGGTPSRRNRSYFGGLIPWVKTTEVQNNEITATEETLTEEGIKGSSARIYPRGSLIVAMYGQGATRGRTAKLGIDAATNQACAVLFNILPCIETDFLWFFLMSQYEAMRALASGNNQPNLNAEMISRLQIPVPSLAIQRELVERMQTGRAEIAHEREMVARITREVEAEVEARILGSNN